MDEVKNSEAGSREAQEERNNERESPVVNAECYQADSDSTVFYQADCLSPFGLQMSVFLNVGWESETCFVGYGVALPGAVHTPWLQPQMAASKSRESNSLGICVICCLHMPAHRDLLLCSVSAKPLRWG